MRFSKKREKKTRQAAYGLIERRSIVSALEKARAKGDTPAIESALRLLQAIDESPVDYIAYPF